MVLILFVKITSTRAITAIAMRKAGFERVEYIELRDAETLLPSHDPTRPRRMLATGQQWRGGSRPWCLAVYRCSDIIRCKVSVSDSGAGDCWSVWCQILCPICTV